MTNFFFKRCLSQIAVPLKLSYNSFQPIIPSEKAIRPIVALHGLLSGKDIWSPMAQKLACKAEQTVFILDLRHHGESQVTNSNQESSGGSKVMALDVANFIEEMNIDLADFICHGFGSHVLFDLVEITPSKIGKIVSIDIDDSGIPGVRHKSLSHILAAMKEVQRKHKVGESVTTAKARLYVNLLPFVQDDTLLKYLMSKIIVGTGGQVEWKYDLDGIEKCLDYYNVVGTSLKGRKTLPKDVLFIDSRRRSESQLPRTFFPLSEVKYIRSDHFVQLDKPEEFIETVSSFL